MAETTIKIFDPKTTVNTALVKVECVATGFQFTEGPLWHPEGFLLFSDTPANCIYHWSTGQEAAVFQEKSGGDGLNEAELSDMIGSNGLAFNSSMQLLICQHGQHGIARRNAAGILETIVSEFEGRKFNSPNDLLVDSNGGIYFTDPPYGLRDQVLHPSAFQPRAGVYYYREGVCRLMMDELRYPNGLCFSPDQRKLYLSSNHSADASVWQFEIGEDGTLEHPSLLIQQHADGMTTDKKGNLYLCTDEGVLIVSAEGKRIALQSLPEMPSNICWGPDQLLYVTARSSVYQITGFHP